jgi:hypothetical protein
MNYNGYRAREKAVKPYFMILSQYIYTEKLIKQPTRLLAQEPQEHAIC